MPREIRVILGVAGATNDALHDLWQQLRLVGHPPRKVPKRRRRSKQEPIGPHRLAGPYAPQSAHCLAGNYPLRDA